MDRERDWKKLKMSLEDPYSNLLTKPRVVREKARNKLRCSVSVDQPDKAVSKAMRSCLLMLHSRRLIRAAPSSGRGVIQIMAVKYHLLYKGISSTFERSCYNLLYLCKKCRL